MSELIEDRVITSIPSGEIQPSIEEKLEEQKKENILEVKNVDELQLDELDEINEIKEPTQIFKRPIQQPKKKKPLSERQKAHLLKMRQRKAEKAKLRKNKKSIPKKEVVYNKVVEKPIEKPIIIDTIPLDNKTPNKSVNFNFDEFLGNVDKMINVLNKWNGSNMRRQNEPQQIQKQISRVQPTKKIQKPISQPSTMDFLNRSLHNNFRRPFE
tara:strand:- start:4876 stop:5511 length:636 start_codon:yes stop_codon:yes gene_type:complete